MDRYCALIADVKGSKSYKEDERLELQLLLRDALSVLNRFYEEGIEKNVVFSGGDEVQGLFRDPLVAFLYFRMLGLILGFDVLRGGLGVGEWSVRVDSQESPGQDGPVYHRARSAIAETKKGRRFDAVIRSDGMPDDALTTLMDHSLSICRMRTATQTETACVVEFFYPLVPECWSERSAFDKSRLLYPLVSLINRRRFASNGRDRKSLADRIGEKDSAKGESGALHPRVLVFGNTRSSMFRIEDDDLVGAAYQLADFSGMSRQGIDRQISNGCISQERNAVAFFAYALSRLARGW